ncbi:MAG: toll/interleukin-1 receptor domain-containing protein [Halopenitus sp.]
MDIEEVKQSAVEYVELEADTEVESIDLADSFSHFGDTSYVFTTETTDDEQSEWWVVAGETPTNLHPKSQFENPDYVFSFHRGLMSRMGERQLKEMDEPPEGEKYDVFISHSSDDKSEFVEPLVRELNRKGHLVWYDDDELEIGDSIRESIDEGLSRAHCGIVVLSDSFFDKSWTEYELNGLTSRDVSSEAPVILPIWYQIGKEEVMEYSLSRR